MKGFFTEGTEFDKTSLGSVPRCGACGLYKDCQTPKIPVQGEGGKRVLIVGDAPGIQEDESGELFTGQSGQKLRECLGTIGIDLEEDAWVTNSLICHTDKLPDSKQVGWCRPNLASAISKLKPRVVITLGRFPLTSILAEYWTRVDELERWVGWKIPLERHWLCPTYHPNFLSRQKNSLVEKKFIKDLRRAFAIDRDPPKQPDWEEKVEILYEEDEIVDALEEIGQSEWTAFDYETNCLKPEYPEAKIYSCAVSNGDRTISYLWKGGAIEATGEYLRGKSKKIASNLKFEEKWTRMEFGHGVRNWGWDTMIAAHCQDNRPGICSIKFQSFVKLGCPSYNEVVAPYLSSSGWYNRIHHIDVRQLLLYGGMDAILEYKVAMKQRKEMGY